LFFTLPARLLTGQHTMSSPGRGRQSYQKRQIGRPFADHSRQAFAFSTMKSVGTGEATGGIAAAGWSANRPGVRLERDTRGMNTSTAAYISRRARARE
jgi:hypothetical protein